MSPERFTLDPVRQRWRHGPIDLIVQAEGEAMALQAAHQQAWTEFQTLLATLVQELPILRRAVQKGASQPCHGAVARSMWLACEPLAEPDDAGFITPMAAVAGSVAQHLLRCYERPGVQRAAINNGGDIALYLTPGTHWTLGVVSDIKATWLQALGQPDDWRPDAQLRMEPEAGVRGVATSGWSGRSLSRGIADSVTVLAATAAQADAAATMIANRVDVEHPGIVRWPADRVRDDSDLGQRLVTRDVPPLALGEITTALERGLAYAQGLVDRGLIRAALITCQRQFVACGHEACLPRSSMEALV
jgi:ApbE superfamily uncharacterized protein (UPF0280 family)